MREYEQEKTKKKHENIFLKMRGARLRTGIKASYKLYIQYKNRNSSKGEITCVH